MSKTFFTNAGERLDFSTSKDSNKLARVLETRNSTSAHKVGGMPRTDSYVPKDWHSAAASNASWASNGKLDDQMKESWCS